MTRLLVVARNNNFPALSDGTHTASRAVTAARLREAARPDDLQVDGRAAPSFDATADQWIHPPSGMTPVAGTAADLRHQTRKHPSGRKTRSEADPPSLASGRPSALRECLTVALGLTVFGLVAAAFLVLA